jgi:hypothetical protein
MGYATLDSIRAVLSSTNITGINPNPTITLNGYSGGSIAAGWVSNSVSYLKLSKDLSEAGY